MPIKNKIKLNLSVTEEDIYRRGSWKGEGRKEISRATCAASTSAKYLSARSSRGLSRYSFRDDATWRGPRYTRHALSVVFRFSSSSSFFFFAFYPQRQGWFYEHERIYRRNERECRQLVKPNEKLGGEPPIIRLRFSEKSKYMHS